MVRTPGRCASLSAALLLVAWVVSRPVRAEGGPDLPAFTATLDALVADERAQGGWTFAAAAGGGRPQPFTVVMQVAERVAEPLGLARWDLLVVRSPGTPAAGLLLLAGHRLTGRQDYLDAARRAGDLLVAAQLPSGGWVSEMPVEGAQLAAWFPWVAVRTTLDDDVTPGAVRFLLALWERTGQARYRDAAERGVELLLRAQLPSGAWPHCWRPPWLRAVRSSREDHPSLNDGMTPIAIETLLAAATSLGRPEPLAAARRGGEWLLSAQLPPPRAGWAQQYDDDGRPAGMRAFEPAALASWETRHAVDALDALARATGEPRWCRGVRAAAGWLAAAAIAPGCWARFYGLDDGMPIYLDALGARVASVDAARAGYDWRGEFGIAALLGRLGLSPTPAPAAPLAGDPGACPGTVDPLHVGHGARGLMAEAGMELAVLEPPAISPCAGMPAELVAAGALR